MDYAFIKDNICINIVVFNSVEEVCAFEQIFKMDGSIDFIIPLKDGFGIHDKYIDGSWAKNMEVIDGMIKLSLEEKVVVLQEENAKLKTQVQAMNENQTFLEDCIIELAQEVYK